MKKSRNFVVFATLSSALGLTCVLLMALSPHPLSGRELLALENPATLNVIFDTENAFRAARWQHIYIHHSKTESGNAAAFGQSPQGPDDHFIIGNGSGSGDGVIEVSTRWTRQQAASGLKDGCIAICLVGDFDSHEPTQSQLRQLRQLIDALRARSPIATENIIMADQANSTAGVGRRFPASILRQQLGQ